MGQAGAFEPENHMGAAGILALSGAPVRRDALYCMACPEVQVILRAIRMNTEPGGCSRIAEIREPGGCMQK